MPPTDRLPTGALVVRKSSNGAPFYEAKWRYRGHQRLRRVGPAWLVEDGAGGWKPRPGRLPADAFDEKRATVHMAAMIEADAAAVDAAADEERARRDRPVTFREVAASWLEWLREV